MSDVFKVVRGFLGKHVGEVGAIADALDTLLSVVPVNAGDRGNIAALIARVRVGAANIEKAVASLSAPTKVTISKADISEAVGKTLPNIVREEVGRILAQAVQTTDNSAAGDALRDTIRREVEAQVAALTVATGGTPAGGAGK